MNAIEKLAEIFKEFPGIGERQANRFVYFLMSKTSAYNENLSSMIADLKKETSQCEGCFRFFIKKSSSSLCEICQNENTDSSLLMIVEKDSDLESMNKSGLYHGKYFILGGLVPIVEKNTHRRIRINELMRKIEGENKKLKEIILAFSMNPQGNHTDFYIRNQLKDSLIKFGIKISSLGRGLSTGTELEYSDTDTLDNALKNRQ